MSASVDAGVVQCWNCKGPVDVRALFCSTCGAVQPPGDTDHFARLGLTRDYLVDPAALDRQYFGFQRRLHPDRFATRPPKERALSQQQATALNDAYETLKDPVKRADYLLRLAGRTAGPDGSSDAALLGEAMEMREALAEAEDARTVAELAERAETDLRLCQQGLAESFAADDLDGAARLTARMKYLRKFADEARLAKDRLSRQGV